MKLPSPFSIYDLRFTIGKKPVVPAVPVMPRMMAVDLQPSTFNLQPAQRGIALVITLILLSVTLIMALALLALSNRERNSVTTTTDTAHAKLAADSALAAAQAQIMANLFATTNGAFNFGLLVSTNYQNPYGLVAGIQNPTNVNYDYNNGGVALTAAEFVQNVANLEYLPRVPVFITNALTGKTDFRFYLDLNRNGIFDTNGLVPDVDANNNSLGANIFEVGDPEWIGVLARPDALHSANNQFIARYAFFAQPIGNGLDINAIYNEASDNGGINTGTATANFAAFDGFLRNQGVGSWEINLAAFLADLNTNQWDSLTVSPYFYNPPPFAGGNTGAAFEDARALLSYRYGFSYTNLAGLGALSANASVLANNYPADVLPRGPLMTNTSLLFGGYSVNTNNPWAGSDNTNQFFDLMTELYDTSKVPAAFTNRLILAGNGNNSVNPSTYDRYTFYRMLSQLGTDSDPDAGKMNLNYSNVLVTYSNGLPTAITVIPGAETNLVSWDATNFFIAAANRMLLNYSANWFANSPSNYLRTYYGATNYNYYHYDAAGNYITNDPSGFGLTNTPIFGNNNQLPFAFTNGIPAFGLTNIPVYVNGSFVYSPAVNRVLQLAANLYDASTNNTTLLGKDFPSVFRPTFLAVLQNGYTNVYINGYQQVISVSANNDVRFSSPIDINYLQLGNSVVNYANGVNIYNVPWIIGAKKGFPNFNNFSEEHQVGVVRRIQVTRNANSTLTTNLLYTLSLKSSIGADFWNSYASNYNDNVSVVLQGSVNFGLTNSESSSFGGNLGVVLNNMAASPGSYGVGYIGSGGINSNSINSGGLGYFYSYVSNTFSPWLGTAPPINKGQPAPGSLMIWSNNVTVLPDSVYRSTTASAATYPSGLGLTMPNLIPNNYFNNSSMLQLFDTNDADAQLNYQLPQFELLTTNRFQAYIIDTSVTPNRIIDYVQLRQIDSFNVNSNVFINSTASANSVWNTNTGVANQVAISMSGTVKNLNLDATWPQPDAGTSSGNFYYFMGGRATTNQMQAGYTPACLVVGYAVWSANDPLVHYTVGDLTIFNSSLPQRVSGSSAMLPTLGQLGVGKLNINYAPWGFTNNVGGGSLWPGETSLLSTNGFAFWLKDSMPSILYSVGSSSNWDFPTFKYPSVGWIGRVHRGTPWQTVYLKSTDVLKNLGDDVPYQNQNVLNGQVIWSAWTGDQNIYDSGNSAPVFDRQLFDLFTTALNDNATRGTLSVNVGAGSTDLLSGLAGWSAVLSGVAVPTSTTNSYTNISPAGIAGTNSNLGQIVSNINATRTTFTNSPDGVVGTFEHVGDVLSTPYLTRGLSSVSPLLTGKNANYINDEVYEALPQQIMGLLRVSSTPRYVIYAYGQTLRPANKGLVVDSSAFGLVTNYQVVAESAVRAVVSVQTNIVVTPTGFQTNYSAKVESYNVLPPN